MDTDNVTAAAGESSFNIVNAVLSAKPISVAQAMAAVESDTAGAVVSFSGVVRNHDAGKLVERLSYSAHPTAQEVMADVIRQLVADYIGEDHCELVRIWAGHRVACWKSATLLWCAQSPRHTEVRHSSCALSSWTGLRRKCPYGKNNSLATDLSNGSPMSCDITVLIRSWFC